MHTQDKRIQYRVAFLHQSVLLPAHVSHFFTPAYCGVVAVRM